MLPGLSSSLLFLVIDDNVHQRLSVIRNRPSSTIKDFQAKSFKGCEGLSESLAAARIFVQS
jgi:hypothetical protein